MKIKIKLIKKNVDAILDAYNLTFEEFESIVKKFFKSKPKNLTNKFEHVMPFVAILDDDLLQQIINVVSNKEKIKIESVIDLIEVICNVKKDIGELYLKILAYLILEKIEACEI